MQLRYRISAVTVVAICCLTACSEDKIDTGTPAGRVAATVEAANRDAPWYPHVTEWNVSALAADLKVRTDYSAEEVDSYRQAVAICRAYEAATAPEARKDVYIVVDGVLRDVETEVDGSTKDASRPTQLARLATQSGDKECLATPSWLEDKAGLDKAGIPYT